MTDRTQWMAWNESTKASVDFAIEQAKLDFALAIERRMNQSHVTRADLARRLGTSGAAVTVALRGDANVTIDRMVRMADALDAALHIHVAPKSAGVRWFETYSRVPEEQAQNATTWARQAIGEQHGHFAVSAA